MIQKVSFSPAFAGKVVIGRDAENRERTLRDINSLPENVKGKVVDEFLGLKQEIAERTPKDKTFAMDFKYFEDGTQLNPNKPVVTVQITQEFPEEDRHRRYLQAASTDITGENKDTKIEKMFDDARVGAMKNLYVTFDSAQDNLLDVLA